VVNLTESDHPMHLHGFYFQMLSKGNGVRDSLYAPNERRLAVTEIIAPFQTMSFAWSPTRSGNWIYHCHYAGHLALASLEGHEAHGGSHGDHQMFGLVLGIRVAPRGRAIADTRSARQLRLVVREKAGVYGDRPGYAFVLDGSPDAFTVPGPTLVLQKGERVAITIVNQSNDRASVHWHGIELESFPDGVPGWSGHGDHVIPSIAPNDSLTVRFTPPRAGTFMYHSHFNEDHQINSGLYGSIVVLEPGERFDPETDRVMLFSSAGPTTNVIAGPYTPTLLNGKAQPDTIQLRVGQTYRFRLIDITGDVTTQVMLLDGEDTAEWRAIAKDGATLPPSQATMRRAVVVMDPGEIYDFEFTPKAAGMMVLRYAPPRFAGERGLPGPVLVPVRVR
jgi:FtsP/CotA-like multicopper oxidase with cupredoxin domain